MGISAAEIWSERAARITAREESRIIGASEDGQKFSSERKQGLQLGAPAKDRGESEAFYKEGRAGPRDMTREHSRVAKRSIRSHLAFAWVRFTYKSGKVHAQVTKMRRSGRLRLRV